MPCKNPKHEAAEMLCKQKLRGMHEVVKAVTMVMQVMMRT